VLQLPARTRCRLDSKSSSSVVTDDEGDGGVANACCLCGLALHTVVAACVRCLTLLPCLCTDADNGERQCAPCSSTSSPGLVGRLPATFVGGQLGPAGVFALAAAAAQPDRQVVQRPTTALMILYFKKYLQHHMTDTGVAGTEHMSLSSACSALERQHTGCTQDAEGLVAQAMEGLRQEAAQGERKSEEQLAWDLARAIAEQHKWECEQGEDKLVGSPTDENHTGGKSEQHESELKRRHCV
jgi:hypothetical protein